MLWKGLQLTERKQPNVDDAADATVGHAASRRRWSQKRFSTNTDVGRIGDGEAEYPCGECACDSQLKRRQFQSYEKWHEERQHGRHVA